MYIKLKFLGHRIVFYCRKVIDVDGVNSTLKDGYHIPMIDCDNCTYSECRDEVLRLQTLHHLGAVSICSTGREDSYHIYIWNKMSWRDAVKVVASCKLVDMKYLSFSLRRGNFTLRISDKKGRVINCIYECLSAYNTTACPSDFESFVRYETASYGSQI